MFWLTDEKHGQWYVMIVCKECTTRTVLFPDETNGEGEFEQSYLFKCPGCDRQDKHVAERYWNPPFVIGEKEAGVGH